MNEALCIYVLFLATPHSHLCALWHAITTLLFILMIFIVLVEVSMQIIITVTVVQKMSRVCCHLYCYKCTFWTLGEAASHFRELVSFYKRKTIA